MFIKLSAKSLQSCPTLCDPMDCRPPGSSLHAILQARVQDGLPCAPLGDLPNPGIEPAFLTSLALADRFFTASAAWESPITTHTEIHSNI